MGFNIVYGNLGVATYIQLYAFDVCRPVFISTQTSGSNSYSFTVDVTSEVRLNYSILEEDELSQYSSICEPISISP